MLFDLRSRGRRRTVQGVYLGLALLMGGGLVLFGVGAGNGFGGILNAFTGGGSSSAAEAGRQPAGEGGAQGQTAAAQRPAGMGRARPGALRSRPARATTTTPPPARTPPPGSRSCAQRRQAWQRYLQLTKHPSPDLARARRPGVRRHRRLHERGERVGDRDGRQPHRRQPTTSIWPSRRTRPSRSATATSRRPRRSAWRRRLQQFQLQQQLKQLKTALVTSARARPAATPGK